MDSPTWAQLMYSGTANFHEIVDMREEYWSNRAYEKTLDERNFKHWLMQVEHRVGPDGFIQDAGEWAAEVFTNGGGLEKQLNLLNSTNSEDPNWQPIGPFETWNNGSQGHFPVSEQCNVYCFDQSISSPEIAIAGLEGGDLFKTTDYGMNWTPLTLNVPGIRTVTQCAIAPTSANRMYFVVNNTIYGSEDGGSTWSLLSYLGAASNQLTVHPTNPEVVYVATNIGLQRSLNGGVDWTTLISGVVWDICFHPTEATTVYALVHQDMPERCSFQRSDDSGETFTLYDDGYFTPSDQGEADDHGGRLGVTPADPNRVYVGLLGKGKESDKGWIGLYRSNDKGGNWTNPNGQDGAPHDLENHPCLATANIDGSGVYQGFYNYGLAVSHNDADVVWVGVQSLSSTDDGGVTWKRIGGYGASTYDLGWVHVDIQDIHVQGNDIWFATDGGLNYSNDELTSHTSRKRGIYNSTLWGFAQGWNSDVQAAGRYHNGNMGFRQDFGTGNQLALGGGEAPTGYVNPLDNNELHFSDIHDKRLPESFSGTPSNIGNLSLYPNEDYSLSNSSELVYDPLYAHWMALGNESVFYRSFNNGWQFEAYHDFGSGKVLEIEQGRTNRDLFYAAVQQSSISTLHKSTDGGITWTAISGLPSNWQKMEIALNPSDDNDIWVIKANAGEIKRSLDGGGTWSDVGNGLQNEQLHDIVCLGGAGSIAISRTNVFHRATGENSWTSFDSGTPELWMPLECIPFYRDAVLRLGDKGKGIWQADFPFVPEPIAQPMTSKQEVFCPSDIVQFDCHSILVHEGASWAWSFDPEAEWVSDSDSRNPTVRFGQAGDYDVTLTVTDAEGNTATHTAVGMVQVGEAINCQASGVPGESLACSGTNGFGVTHDLDLETNTYTSMAWINPTGIQPAYTGIIISEEPGGGLNFLNNNELGYHWPGGDFNWSSGLNIPEDEWSHVAMSVGPDGVRLYLNGIEKHHSFSAGLSEQGKQFLGSYRGFNYLNMLGSIDEVKIWNRTLTIEEIREQRHLTIPQETIESDAHLVAYYQFNEDIDYLFNKSFIGEHGEFNGVATLTASQAVVGSGVLDRIAVNGEGSYSLAQVGGSIDVPSGASSPGGDVVINRMDPPPFGPAEDALPIGYWVVDIYGSAFDVETSWTMVAAEGSLAPWAQEPGNLTVVTRNANGTGDWSEPCSLTTIDDESALYSGSCGPVTSAQYGMTSELCADENIDCLMIGCLDPAACNYNSSANANDDCTYASGCDTCSGETDGTGTVNSAAELTLEINPDNFPSEISWSLTDADGVTISEGDYPLENETTQVFCVVTGCYTFLMSDSFGDGLGSSSGSQIGSYSMSMDGNTLFGNEGDYGAEDENEFCLTLGCTDSNACNFNSAANANTNCAYASVCDSCSGETDGTGTIIDNDDDDDTVCDADEVEGCTDPTACNYNEDATENNGSCSGIPAGDCDCNGNVLDECGECGGTGASCSGCMDSAACNFSDDFTINVASACAYLELTLEINPDPFPAEIGWSLTSGEDLTLTGALPLTNGTTQSFCSLLGCYTFTITDSFGDGLECVWPPTRQLFHVIGWSCTL